MPQVDRQSQYIQGYRLLYRPTGGSWLQQDVKAALEHSAVLNNLLKGTEYEVKIRPYFNEFQGIDSLPLILRTPEEGETLILECLCNPLLLFVDTTANKTLQDHGVEGDV